MLIILLILFNNNLPFTSFFTAGTGYQDFYVSSIHPNRSDSNPGTDPNYPWATFGKVAGQWYSSTNTTGKITAGDIVHLDKGSTFNVSSEWRITSGGTVGHPITIRGDDYDSQSKGTLAILNVTAKFGAVFWINSGNYITLRDFHINGNGKNVSSGVTIGGSGQPSNITNIEVLNLKIYNLASDSSNYSSGIWLAADMTHSVSNCLIQGNDISGYNAWGINSYPKKTTGGFQGFHYNNIFRNNYVHGFHEPRYGSLGGGFHIALGGGNNIYEYNLVEGGTFIGAMTVVNNSATETGLIIRYNILKNNTGLTDISGANKTGILFTNDFGGYPDGNIEAEVYGNIITGNDHPAIVFDSGNVFSQGYVNIYNNTIYNNNKNIAGYSTWNGTRSGAEIVIATPDNIKINLKNNIIAPTQSGVAALKIASNYPETIVTSNNLYWNSIGTNQVLVNKKGTTYTSANIVSFESTAKSANPLFTNASLTPTSINSTTGTDPDGLKPQVASVANKNGANLGTPFNYDIDLKQRSTSWAMGAYEIIEASEPNLTENFYVSSIHPNRSDSNPGTDPNYPWATFGKVVDQWHSSTNTTGKITAGDTVHFERGSTFSTVGWQTINSGGNATEGYITIRGDDYGSTSAAKAVFKKLSSETTNVMFLIKASYIKLIGFTIDGGNIHTYAGVLVQNAGSNISNIHVINITMKNLGPGGTYTNGIFLQPKGGKIISDCLIEDNDISGFSAWGLNEYPDEDFISDSRNNNNIWRGNYVHDYKFPMSNNVGGGVQKVFGGNNNLWENNLIEGDYWSGSFVLANGCGDEVNLTIRNNIIRNNRCSVTGCRAVGLNISADTGNSYSTSKLTANVYNNIIYGNKGAGIRSINNMNSKYWYTGTVNVYNNIIYNNSDGTETTDYKGEVQFEDSQVNFNLKNNIIVHSASDVGLFIDDYTGTLNHSNNLYWHNGGNSKTIISKTTTNTETYTVASAKNYEPTAQNTNPLLNSTSLKPSPSSAVVDTAANLGATFSKDLSGNTRLDPWDIGAYEVNATDTNEQPPITPNCTMSTLNTFQNYSLQSQDKNFTATWKAIPAQANMNGVIAFSWGTQSAYTSFNALIRFYSDGKIDVAKGNLGYNKDINFNYTAGTSYYFRAEIDPKANIYSVYVKAENGTEQLIAKDYPFRASAPVISQINNYATISNLSTFQVCDMNVKLTPVNPPIVSDCKTSVPNTFQNYSIANQSTAFTATWKAIPLSANIDGVTGFSSGSQNAYANFNALTRFFTNGRIEAANGNNGYNADTNLYYTAGTNYYFRAVINPQNKTYSIYARAENGIEQLIAKDYPFRTNNSNVTQINNYTIRSGAETFKLCDFTIAPIVNLDTIAPITIASGFSSDFNVQQKVVLSCTDNLSGCAKTFYNINNSAYTQYITPLMITANGNNVVKYYSEDNSQNIEEEKSIIVKVDSVGPSLGQTTLSGFVSSGGYITGSGKILSQKVTDTGSGVKTNSCYYSKDATNTQYAATWEVDHCEKPFILTNGATYKFNFSISDNLGNIGNGIASATYIADMLKPITTITYSTINSTDREVTITCSDSGSGCKETNYIIGGVLKTVTTPYTFTSKKVTIYYYSTDKVNNKEYQKRISIR